MEENFTDNQKSLNSLQSYCFTQDKKTIQDLATAKDSRSPSLEEKMENNKCIHQLIKRKTRRGRKEKISLPKHKIKCEICLEYSDSSTEDLISCSTCKCLFHYSCHNQCEITKDKDTSSYKCVRCAYVLKLNMPINSFHCFICGYSDGVLNRNSANNEFYHQICLDYLNEINIEDNDKNVCRENIRKWRYKNTCRFCGEKLCKSKAVIKCKKPKCKGFFHIPCAIEKGMIFDLKFMKKYYNVKSNAEIPFFCSNHNKKVSFLYKNYVLNLDSGKKMKNGYPFNLINKRRKRSVLTEKSKIRYKKRKFINNDKKSKTKFIIINNENDNQIKKSENLNENNIINNEVKEEKVSIVNKKDEIFPSKEKENEKDKENNLNGDNLNNSFENNNNNDSLDFAKIIKDNNIIKDNRNNFYEDNFTFNNNFQYKFDFDINLSFPFNRNDDEEGIINGYRANLLNFSFKD